MSQETQEKPNLDMAQWLAEMLASRSCPGLVMIPGSNNKFQIPWCHGKSGGLCLNGDDAKFIAAWARHKNYTGRADNKNDLSKWKENFRNALNKCCNIIIKVGEAVKNKHKVCQFTDDFIARLETSNLQTRKRLAADCLCQNDCLSQTDCSSIEDNPPIKKLKCTTGDPQLPLKQNDILECQLYIYAHSQPHLNTLTHSQPQLNILTHSPPQLNTVTHSPPQLNTLNHSQPQLNILNNSQPQLNIPNDYKPQLNTLTHSQPQLNTLTHSQPQLNTLNHSQPQLNTLTHSQPQLNTLTHSQPQLNTLTHSQPQLNTHAHSQPQLNTHAHSQPQLNTHAHSQPQLNTHVHSQPQLHTHAHSQPQLNTHAHSQPQLNTHAHSQPQLNTHAHSQPQLNTHVHSQPQLNTHAHSQPQLNTHAHYQPQLNTHVHSQPQLHTHAHSQPQLNTHAHSQPQLNTHVHSQPQLNTHAHSQPQLNTHAHSQPQLNTHVHSQPQLNTHAHSQPQLNTHAHSHIQKPFAKQTSRLSPDSTSTNKDTNFLGIDIFYGSREKLLVKSHFVRHDTVKCRISSCNIPTLNDLLLEEGETLIQLPKLDEIKHCRFSPKVETKIHDILKDMDRGVSLKHNCRDIFIRRGALVKIFLTDGKYRSMELIRNKNKQQQIDFLRAFDYDNFKSDMENFLQKKIASCPKPWFILTVGHEIDINLENPLDGVTVYIKVTHLEANRIATKTQNSVLDVTPALCSHHEPLDLLNNMANYPSVNGEATFIQRPDSSTHPLESFSNDNFRTIENYSFDQTRCPVMAVEVFYLSHCVVKEIVDKANIRCRMFHGDVEIQLQDDNFKTDGSLEVRLPSVERIKPNEKILEELKKCLTDLNLGIHLVYSTENIFVERRTVLRVFQTDGTSESFKLPRRTMSEKPQMANIFDFTKFSEEFSKYKDGIVHSPPKSYVILTVGHEIEPHLENPLQNVLLQVKVTHMMADMLVNKVKDDRLHNLSLKYSLQDSLDRTVSDIKQLALY